MAVLAGGAVGRPSRFRYWRQWLTAYLFIAPWLIFLLVFVAGAIVLALYFSFTDYDLLSDPVFVGLKNYQKALQDESFLHAIRNVATYTAVVVPSQTFIGLVMAAILDRKIPFRRFFRIAWYLPCVASSVVTTLIFMWLFLPDGFINAALNFVGIGVRINWLGDEATALPSIMFMNIWATAATMMLIFLAAIQDVPGPIYEAANLDGAGPVRQFFQITLPLMRPAIFLVVLLGTIGCFQLYDQVKIATNGGPNEATLTVTYLIWRQGFRDLNMGYASAMGVILFAGIFVISLIQRRVLDVRPDY
ncbi:MAG: sugar ABC transporter permease [Candidatus Rokuibacteriota bacterium]|nr:MAG: sugar ABC transporter permease [Candidatus Rokubacteria bacterium]